VIIQEKFPAFPLSIIIPALNEEKALPGVLASLETQEDDPPFELVLADGGSADATVPRFLELTRSWPVRGRAARALRCARPGRAAQLNMGAREAAGKALLFLHADTSLPPGATGAVLGALSDPEVIGGAFRHAYAEAGLILSWISLWANSRSRLGGVHLGDQAMFARLIYYAPQNPKAFDLLEPAIAKLMPTYPENEKLAHIINFEWWADNLPMMQRRFQQWLQS